MDTSTFREQARQLATQGIGDLARAFNHCHRASLGYRYADDVQAEFLRLAAELVNLVETGHIVPRATMAAQEDAQFQRLMSKTLTPAGEETRSPGG